MPTVEEQLSKVLSRIDDWEAPHAAAAVFNPSGTTASHGNLETVLPVASITKLATSWAALVALEEGAYDLDTPAGPPGSTIEHLLCHASGLPFEGAEPIAAPGQRRIYSNTGYEALAAKMERCSGIRFDTYLTEGVLAPLGMGSSSLVAGPAAGLNSNIEDLVRLGRELLSPRLIDRTTWERATSPVMGELSGVVPGFGQQNPCPWGLGPEIRGRKSPHWTGTSAPEKVFGHFGASGSFLWIDARAGFGCVVLTDRAFGDWAVELWPRFSDEVRSVVLGSDRSDVTEGIDQPGRD